MIFTSSNVRRVLKDAMTPSTWLLSQLWLQTAPSGTQLSQSQKSSWSRCSLVSSSSVKSKKPLTCLRAYTSETRGIWKMDYPLLWVHQAFGCSLWVVLYFVTPSCGRGGWHVFVHVPCVPAYLPHRLYIRIWAVQSIILSQQGNHSTIVIFGQRILCLMFQLDLNYNLSVILKMLFHLTDDLEHLFIVIIVLICNILLLFSLGWPVLCCFS